jgi:gamma-glutamyl:cysteine ligase YbdK (ATP-grasp superfamily)
MSGAEFQRNVRDDLDKWTDQMLASAEQHGFKVERDWLREWLRDAMNAARASKPPPATE